MIDWSDAMSVTSARFVVMKLAQALVMGTNLLEEHGLTGWRVVFDKAKTRAGVCRPERHLIGLSLPLTRLHSDEEVRDTLLHEIAHALVGPKHGHDEVWRAKALEIGCTAMRCVPEDAPRVAGAWLGTCPAGHTIERHRRPERLMSCSQCGSGFDRAHLFGWLYHGRRALMHPNYEAALRDVLGGDDASSVPNRPAAITLGSQVRVIAEGRFHGFVGQVVKRGRTRYHVCVEESVLTVPFSYVEPVQG